MKRITIILTVIASFAIVKTQAQQMYHISQYMFNDYVFNPAIGGIHDYYQVRTNYRYQWAGIKDAPRTYLLSAYGPHKAMPMGYGGFIYSDVSAATSQLGLYGSYAYNVLITTDIRLSMGAFMGLKQFKVAKDQLKPGTEGDPVYEGVEFVKYMPDANIGGYIYNSQFYFGASFNQLFGNKIEFLDEYDTKDVMRKLNNHFFVTGGYKYNVTRDLDLEGSTFFKIVRSAPVQMDLTVRGIWQKTAWGGISWRTGDAIVVLAGYNYSDMLYIGYSYDVTTSQLRKLQSGSHEFMIGARFNSIKNSGAKRKIR